MHVVLLMNCYAMLSQRRQAAFALLVPILSGRSASSIRLVGSAHPEKIARRSDELFQNACCQRSRSGRRLDNARTKTLRQRLCSDYFWSLHNLLWGQGNAEKRDLGVIFWRGGSQGRDGQSNTEPLWELASQLPHFDLWRSFYPSRSTSNGNKRSQDASIFTCSSSSPRVLPRLMAITGLPCSTIALHRRNAE